MKGYIWVRKIRKLIGILIKNTLMYGITIETITAKNKDIATKTKPK